ncbi:iron chelate uptake ABC transporter family permease subunit [Enterococcus saccharolyticus]|uniref:Iron ABC transporter permease n=1 Tax=Candidatus Enterococcus willemsii TaxID=1857215 RepID=A0ABQ6Z2K5_9ENTE|nr:iron ABC transporter permease [Enterococcus sp. CU12B]MCD5003246.1 iron chelate uptake ABC transporter family permease subunit [Enterococcus saccharolyticus]
MKSNHFMMKIGLLLLISIAIILLYLTYNTYGNWEFALKLRGKKILAFLFVSLATSVSTIAFQTITRNQFLTPGILGLDNLYILIQTLLFFFVGGVTMLSQESIWMFGANIAAMTVLSVLFISFFMDKVTGNLFLLLMVGMISGTLFSSISTFVQVLMDPNEYDLLQGRLFASFSNVNVQHLLVAAGIIFISVGILWYVSPELDIMHIGRDHAVNLGIAVNKLQTLCLFCIALLTGTATALVGPTIFLGFIVATISYRLFATYQHKKLFIGSFLLGIILLVGGQFLVEQVFQWNTTISIVIQFAGGIFFLGKILSERKKG